MGSCGWGAITRIVNGPNDELNTDNEKGFLFPDKSKLSHYQWSTTPLLTDDEYHLGNDLFADEFYFNFLGFNGRFYLDYNGTWRVQSDDLIIVECETLSSNFVIPFATQHGYSELGKISKAICTFTLIDSYGTKYTFGGEDAIEYSDLMFTSIAERGKNHFAVSWYLTKIETVNGHIISPVYLKSIDFPLIGQRVIFSTSKSNDLTYSTNDYDAARRFGTEPIVALNDEHILRYIPYFAGQDLESIDEYARFVWLKLDSIEIYDAVHEEVRKSIEFNYLEQASKRLTLLSVISKDTMGNDGWRYDLGYNTTSLLQYLATTTDHWKDYQTEVCVTVVSFILFILR